MLGSTIVDAAPAAVAAALSSVDAEVVAPAAIHAVACDVYAPCALGSALNDRTVPELACEAVCGAANNQLDTPEAEEVLQARGITYVPDYVANAGGIINIAYETGTYDAAAAHEHVGRIYDTVASCSRRRPQSGERLSVSPTGWPKRRQRRRPPEHPSGRGSLAERPVMGPLRRASAREPPRRAPLPTPPAHPVSFQPVSTSMNSANSKMWTLVHQMQILLARPAVRRPRGTCTLSMPAHTAARRRRATSNDSELHMTGRLMKIMKTKKTTP